MEGIVNGVSKTELIDQDDRGEEMYDFVCVGFGPAALAIAIALEDAFEQKMNELRQNSKMSSDSNIRYPKVLFLEKKDQFRWHSGMLIDGAKMQISFLKDLATMRNPRSRFTFLNYLHANDRLVCFSNLDTFLPLRVEFERYLRWCAHAFADLVKYQVEVVDVQFKNEGKEVSSLSSPSNQAPRSQYSHYSEGLADALVVTARDLSPGSQQSVMHFKARNVILATGGKPRIPSVFKHVHSGIIHSSQYMEKKPELLSAIKQQWPDTTGANNAITNEISSVNATIPVTTTDKLSNNSYVQPSNMHPFNYHDNRHHSVGAHEQSIQESKSCTKHRQLPIAVIGSGQSAAEIFADLFSQPDSIDGDHNEDHKKEKKREEGNKVCGGDDGTSDAKYNYNNNHKLTSNRQKNHPKTVLIMRAHALQPTDDSPFVNEVFNPEKVDTFFAMPERSKQLAIKRDMRTNYAVVRIGLIKRIYQEMYMQALRFSRDVFPHCHSASIATTSRRKENLGVMMTKEQREMKIQSEKTEQMEICNERGTGIPSPHDPTPIARETWPIQIRNNTKVERVIKLENGAIRLVLAPVQVEQHKERQRHSNHEHNQPIWCNDDLDCNLDRDNNNEQTNNNQTHLDVCAVVVATGYTRHAYRDLLSACQPFVAFDERGARSGDCQDHRYGKHVFAGDSTPLEAMPELSPSAAADEQSPLPPSPVQESDYHSWPINRNYSLPLDRSRVIPSVNIWLQGCCESTHGLQDSLLSILAVRGAEIVDSIFFEK